MLVSPQISYVKPSSPKIIVIEGRALGSAWGHDGRALMNGISVLIKETPQPSLTPSQSNQVLAVNQKVGAPTGTPPC